MITGPHILPNLQSILLSHANLRADSIELIQKMIALRLDTNFNPDTNNITAMHFATIHGSVEFSFSFSCYRLSH